MTMRAKGIVAVVVSLAVGALLSFLVLDSGELQHRNGGSETLDRGERYGFIYVDSPEIYTRERLVNDRFRQDAWLNDMLDRMSRVELGPQAVLSQSEFRGLSAGLRGQYGAAVSDPGAGGVSDESNVRPGPTGAPPPRDADASPRAHPRERFRRYLDIRDTIRKQVIENQLDDRHDIDTNTLYAFKFDTTVFAPGNETSAWANVEVKIEKPSDADLGRTPRDVFQQWVAYLERVVNEEYEDRRSLVRRLASRQRTERDLYRFAVNHSRLLDASQAVRPRDDKREALRQSIEGSFENRPLPDLVDYIVKLYQSGKLSKPVDGQRALNCLIAHWVVYENISKHGIDQFVTPQLTAVGPVEYAIRIGVRRSGGSKDAMSCAPVRPTATPSPPPASPPPEPELGEELEPDDPFAAAPAALPSPPPASPRPEPELREELEPDDPFAAAPVASPVIISSSEIDGTPSPAPGSPAATGSLIGFTLFKALFYSEGQKLYTYAVSPKEATEVVRRELLDGYLEELRAAAGAAAGVGAVDIGGTMRRDRRAAVQALLRKPVIIGYSDHAQGLGTRGPMTIVKPLDTPAAGPTGRGPARSATDALPPEQVSPPLAAHVGGSAVFGWLIGPRFERANRFRHVPTQNALSALVSLPISWPMVKVTIRTSWIDEDGTRVPAETFSDLVPLPTDYEKLTFSATRIDRSAFGLAPQVFEGKLEGIKLRVGDCANVLIPGRNLWRSTVVTVGAQRSRRITVLPDMDGIIAHFDEIIPPADYQPGGAGGEAEVRVWTSNGSVELAQKAQFFGDLPGPDKFVPRFGCEPEVLAAQSSEGGDAEPKPHSSRGQR